MADAESGQIGRDAGRVVEIRMGSELKPIGRYWNGGNLGIGIFHRQRPVGTVGKTPRETKRPGGLRQGLKIDGQAVAPIGIGVRCTGQVDLLDLSHDVLDPHQQQA